MSRRFVSISNPQIRGMSSNINKKYVQQIYDAMSNSSLNLENIAIQLTQLPNREQVRFFTLFLNYVDVVSRRSDRNYVPVMRDVVELCEKLMLVINEHYEEKQNA